MNEFYYISDAAKEVQVESHVLRYWEEELKLPIKRNELGHRFYTTEDVAQFKQIKNMKERGLQLKAIKLILKDGKLDVLPEENKMAIDIINEKDKLSLKSSENRMDETQEDKAKRLQWMLQQLFRETLQENNRELCREIKESVVKELDYQFRALEDREEEREKRETERTEKYYQKMDEMLRMKTKKDKNLETDRKKKKHLWAK